MSHLSKISTSKLTRQVELLLGNFLNINNNFTEDQHASFLELSQSHEKLFVWDYHDMKELDPKLCTY